MRRLHKLIILACMCTLVPSDGYAQMLGKIEYLLKGSSVDEGTSAVVDFDHNMLLVSGERFALLPCVSEGMSICVKSDYMTFVMPVAAKKLRHWTTDGLEFTHVRDCNLRTKTGEIEVRVFRSTQNNGEFEFFVDGSDALAGWKHSYKTIDGEIDTYEYVRNRSWE